MAEITQQDLSLLTHTIPGDVVIYKMLASEIRVIYYSPNMPSYTGRTDEEYKKVMNEPALVRVFPPDRDLVMERINSALREDREIDCTFRIIHLSKGVVWTHARARFLGTLDGAPVLLMAFFNLSIETNAYADIIDHSDSIVYVIDAQNYELFYANKAALKFFKRHDYAGKKCYEFGRGRTSPCPWCITKRLVGETQHVDEFYDRDLKAYLFIDVQRVQWFERKAIFLYIRNVTELVKQRKKLEDVNLQMSRMIKHIPAGLCVFKRINNVITCIAANPYAADIMGVSVDDLVGKDLNEITQRVHPEERSRCREETSVQLEKNGSCNGIYRVKHKKLGKYVWIQAKGKILRRPGEPGLAYFSFSNATGMKQEEAQYKRTIHELLMANPRAICAFRLNLTQNTCSEGHGSSAYIQRLVGAETATQTLDNIANLITEKSDSLAFRRKINRDRLLYDFSIGKRHVEITYRRHNEQDETRWVNTYVNMIRNPDNNDVEAIAYSVDASREKEEEQIISSITKNEYDYIAIVDIDSRKIRFFNVRSTNGETRPRQMATYDASVQESIRCYLGVDDSKQYLRALSFEHVTAYLDQYSDFIYSFLIQDSQGRQYRKQLTYRYLDASKKKIIFARSDVTASFKAEQEQTRRIRRALLVAEHASEMKSNFLSNVSHDMRTPLNAILGYTRLAKESSDLFTAQDYLDKIDMAGNTLLDLINDTLDLQKIENGVITLKPGPVHSADIMERIIVSIRSLIDEKHIRFIFNADNLQHTAIYVDKMRFQQVFINLLSNAIKFTPVGGTVEFSIDRLREDDKKVYDKITVKDNGIGMSQAFLSKLFEPFTQERTAETAHIGGSGLGLSIVKRIVTLMGGQIEVTSQLGVGSEFTVYLELERADQDIPQEGIQASLLESAQLKGLRVLMCEDNAMNTEIAKLLLEKSGMVVTCASDGKQGVDLFLQNPPGTWDVILMDIRMPVMNGYEATDAIRHSHHEQAASIPIIALSADAYESDVQKSLAAGMNAHIGKPINPQQMYEVIGKICHMQ
jgi:PAS domain S-box-containing protein